MSDAKLTHDEIRNLLITMRVYVIHHGCLLGECAAWNKLKDAFDVESAFVRCKGCGKIVLFEQKLCNSCFWHST